MTRPSPRGAALAAIAFLALAAPACGVTTDPAPREVSSQNIPYGLLEEAPSTTTSTTPPVVPKVPITVYMVAGAHVQPVVREVTEPPTVSKALAALVSGPQEDEAAAGLRSAINPSAGVAPRGVEPDGVITIDLTAEFTLAPSSEQVLGLAQIVFTATEMPGIQAVRFTLEGDPIEVPTPSGSLASGPVGREAFAALALPV